MRNAKRLAAFGAALSTCALAGTVSAQGVALNRFDPAPAGDRLFGTQSGATNGHMQLHLMLMGDYAHNPFVISHTRGIADVGSVVEHQLTLRLNASFALWNRLTFGFDVPIAAWAGR